MKISYYTDDGDKVTMNAPGRWEICSECEGHGRVVAPGVDDNGITESEMDELGEDFREDYFAGRYDVVCSCGGSGKVYCLDTERFSEESPEEAAEYSRWVMEEAEFKRQAYMERKAGC